MFQDLRASSVRILRFKVEGFGFRQFRVPGDPRNPLNHMHPSFSP